MRCETLQQKNMLPPHTHTPPPCVLLTFEHSLLGCIRIKEHSEITAGFPNSFYLQTILWLVPLSHFPPPNILFFNKDKRRRTGDLLRYWLACCWSKSSAFDSVVVFVLMLGLVLTFSASSLPDIFP